MPITLLDIILLAVMLISGLLAMVRGFMREVLSIAAWGAAAIVTLYSYSKLLPSAALVPPTVLTRIGPLAAPAGTFTVSELLLL